MVYKFTKSGEKVLELANEIAFDFGHNYVGTEHILYALCEEENGVASKVLENQSILAEDVLEKIEELVGGNSNENTVVLGFTPRTKKVIENAYLEAKKLGSDYIGTEHILVGIMKEADSIAIRILLDLGMNPEELYNDIANTLNEFEEGIVQNESSNHQHEGSYNNTQNLNQYGTDLTKQAREGKLDPVIRKNK